MASKGKCRLLRESIGYCDYYGHIACMTSVS